MISQDEGGRWSNRAEDAITIVPYDPRWLELFADERCAIRECIDTDVPLAIEHFGSTAIPGVPAKPIIDIMLGADRRHWSTIVQALQGRGYVHWEGNPDVDREFLVKGMPPFGTRRTHHVHLCEVGGPLWERLPCDNENFGVGCPSASCATSSSCGGSCPCRDTGNWLTVPTTVDLSAWAGLCFLGGTGQAIPRVSGTGDCLAPAPPGQLLLRATVWGEPDRMLLLEPVSGQPRLLTCTGADGGCS